METNTPGGAFLHPHYTGFYMRYKSGISNAWRVELPNGNYYRILSINTDKTTGTMILGVELDNSVKQEVTT